MNAYEKTLKGVQWVLDNCTSYQVAKNLEINNRTVNRYQNGESPIENMATGTLGKLYNYYLEEMGRMEKVTFEGIEYTLTQNAYITGPNESPYYEASGVDPDGNEVTVTWEIKEHWLDEDGALNGLLEDESEACDWDNPASVD